MSEYMRKALELAAQCWCDLDTKHIVMDPDLAKAFAKRFAKLLGEVGDLKDLIYHAWIHSSYPGCGYNQMTTEQKVLMNRIIACNTEAGGAG